MMWADSGCLFVFREVMEGIGRDGWRVMRRCSDLGSLSIFYVLRHDIGCFLRICCERGWLIVSL
jgi:hypothetical protein